MVTIKDPVMKNCATVNHEGYLLIKDIEKWISGLVPLVELDKDSKPVGDPTLLMVMDPETNAKFVIGRLT